jgi:hypothetical protein
MDPLALGQANGLVVSTASCWAHHFSVHINLKFPVVDSALGANLALEKLYKEIEILTAGPDGANATIMATFAPLTTRPIIGWHKYVGLSASKQRMTVVQLICRSAESKSDLLRILMWSCGRVESLKFRSAQGSPFNRPPPNQARGGAAEPRQK